MAEFETECELFSYHGEEMARIGKNYASKNMSNSFLPDQIIPLFFTFYCIVFGNNPIGKEWKERKNNFENWIKEDMIEKHFQLHTEKRF